MGGVDVQQATMYSYLSAEERVPLNHPLRAVRKLTDKILGELSKLFSRMYSQMGRPSIAPEKLLRALLLQVLYTVRSERMLMEQLDYNMLFRWFVGLNLDEAVWDVTVFTKNRDRLLEADVAREFFRLVVAEAQALNLMSDERFTVDGTLLEACASLKSFKRIDGEVTAAPPDDPGNPTVDFHGEERSNQTHASTTDEDAMLARKGAGKEAKLSYSGHVLMENRNGLVAEVEVLQANGTAERDAALVMIRRVRQTPLNILAFSSGDRSRSADARAGDGAPIGISHSFFLLQPGINLAAMTRRAIDKALFRLSLNVLHLPELLVDHPVHDGHFSGGSLLTLAVTGEVLGAVTVGAGYAEGAAVSSIHNVNENASRRVLEQGQLDILEHISRRLPFSSGNKL